MWEESKSKGSICRNVLYGVARAVKGIGTKAGGSNRQSFGLPRESEQTLETGRSVGRISERTWPAGVFERLSQ